MVVCETMKMMMDDDASEAIVSMLMELQEQDNTNIPPVSYTHLDVYKRQVVSCNSCSFSSPAAM